MFGRLLFMDKFMFSGKIWMGMFRQLLLMNKFVRICCFHVPLSPALSHAARFYIRTFPGTNGGLGKLMASIMQHNGARFSLMINNAAPFHRTLPSTSGGLRVICIFGLTVSTPELVSLGISGESPGITSTGSNPLVSLGSPQVLLCEVL